MLFITFDRPQSNACAEYIQILGVPSVGFDSDWPVEQEVCEFCEVGHGNVRSFRERKTIKSRGQ